MEREAYPGESPERKELRELAPLPLSDSLGQFWPPPHPREIFGGESEEAVAARAKADNCQWHEWHSGWGDKALEDAWKITDLVSSGRSAGR